MIRAAIAAAALFTTAMLAPQGADADALDRIRATGEIRLAVRDDAPPLSYVEDGVHQGFTVDICRRLAERLAQQLGVPNLARTLMPVSAENRFEAIALGRADLLCGAASVTIQRRARVDFSIPVFVDGASMMMREGFDVDFTDLTGKRLGVRAGTTTSQALLNTLRQAGMTAAILEFEDHNEGVASLKAGEIDAYMGDQSILMGLARADGSGLAVARNTLTIEPQALAMGLGENRLRLEVDRALSRMWREGEIAALFDKAFAPAEPGEAMRALGVLAPIPE
jgi:polar amino acid transport system substrate-binding protein